MIRFRRCVLFRTRAIAVFAALGLALAAVSAPAGGKAAARGQPQACRGGGPEAKQPDKEGWISLFDGKSLGDWKSSPRRTSSRHGEVLSRIGRSF